ncbi:hypothetical protein ACH518_00385 (plasmid) [Methylomonas sp. HW2-6]|uniref:hypothetical protein n=1 Tax=Methylomonas sp. HW2-6 TaxID=3376687 RepID=UPI0040411D59
MNKDQKLIELHKIKRKLQYCGIPALLAFISVATSEMVGLGINNYDLIFSIGAYSTWALIAFHVISATCPNCDKRFFSIWALSCFINIKKLSCCNCKFSIPADDKPKPYRRSTGDEWNQ